ncbi:Mu transposase C-terminal domain-containing protein [Fredinandcohnia humi]
MLIVENMILLLLDMEQNQESLQRVLWVSSDQDYVVLVDITDRKNMKYPFFRKYEEIVNEAKEGQLRKLEIDPDLRLISPDEEYLNKYRAKRDVKWEVIKDIVVQEPDIYISEKRGPLVSMVEEITGKNRRLIYDYLKKYWFYGKSINGLLNDYFNCGSPGKPRNITKKTGPRSADGNDFIVTEKDKEIFKKAIKLYHEEGGMDITETHQHMCEKWYSSGLVREQGVLVSIVKPEKSPTLKQFRTWYTKSYSKYDREAKRRGKRKAEMEVRALLGNAEERATSVGALFEIDSTPADIILVAEDRKTILGSPTLYMVKDVYSRFIGGFNATLSHASSVEQMVAIENTATNKVEFCRRYGIEIEESDWPCAHLPRMIAGDRGELKAKMSENLVNINVEIANAPSFRGDLKPFIEQHFSLTNKKIRALFSQYGAKPPKLIERGDKDPAKNAVMTIYEFTQFMIMLILTYNKSALPKEYIVTQEMFEDKVELTPLGIWNWNRGKKLLHVEPRDLLRYNLLPKEDATVTRYGIKWKGMCYASPRGIKEGWFVEESIDGEKQIKISYDPRNISSIFIRLKDGSLDQCVLTDKFKEYDGLHLEDVKAILKYKKDQLNQKEKEEKQHNAVLNAFSRKLAENAKRETQAATTGMSYNQRQKDKRENRKAEARERGSKDAWTAVTPSKSGETNNHKAEIVEFPSRGQSNSVKETQSEIQKRFSEKNKNRRRNHESME